MLIPLNAVEGSRCSLKSELGAKLIHMLVGRLPLCLSASLPHKSRGNAGDLGRSSGLVDTQVKYQLRRCRKNPAGHEPLQLDGSRRSDCSVNIQCAAVFTHGATSIYIHATK